jgi:predicted phosphodiesterase
MGMKAKSGPKKPSVVAKTLVAKGEDGDTAESRASHIAEKIGECAAAMKIEPCDLTWSDFRSYGSVAYGENKLGIVRRDITRLGGFNALRDSHFPPTPTDYAGIKKRVREHANLNRRLGYTANDDEFQFKQIEAFTSRIFSGRVKPVKIPRGPLTPNHIVSLLGKPVPASRIKRAVVVCIGDTHWGSDLLASETGALNYGKVEEARRLAQVVKQTIEYKPEYRHETELHVVLLGDLIHGNLHDLRDGAVTSEQQSRAIHLLIQAIAQFSAAYPKVTCHAVTGNHGRDKSRHQKPATAGKADSRETLIYSAVKMATRDCANVTWDIPMSAFATFSLFNRRVFVTHGDGVIRVGNPGQSINVAELEKQTNRLNATLKDYEEFSVVIVGHVHQSAKVLLNNGVTAIINGPMTPVDPFAVSIGLFESVSSQQIFESVPGFPVGDSRTITLDANVDNDSSLDEIVRPWTSF